MADSVTKNEPSPIQDIISSPAAIVVPQPASAPALHSPSSATLSAPTSAATTKSTTPPAAPAAPATSATPAPASTTRPQAHPRPFSSTSITKKFLQQSQHSPSSTSSSSTAQAASGTNASTPTATGSVANPNGPSKSTSRACASASLHPRFLSTTQLLLPPSLTRLCLLSPSALFCVSSRNAARLASRFSPRHHQAHRQPIPLLHDQWLQMVRQFKRSRTRRDRSRNPRFQHAKVCEPVATQASTP
jgi:hypothetical protein